MGRILSVGQRRRQTIPRPWGDPMSGRIPYALAREVAEAIYGPFVGAPHGTLPIGWILDTSFNRNGTIDGTGDPGEIRLSNGLLAYALRPEGVDDGHRILAFRGTEPTHLTDLYTDSADI